MSGDRHRAPTPFQLRRAPGRRVVVCFLDEHGLMVAKLIAATVSNGVSPPLATADMNGRVDSELTTMLRDSREESPEMSVKDVIRRPG